MSSTRQLAAIMFTDIVGYTALMGSDEQKAMDLVRKNRDVQKPLVEKHNGKWLKEMGDGAMSSFSTASDAIYCALEIQQMLLDDTQLNLRIGIHLGEIMVEDGDVFGDGVNIASRLESIAEPGGIYISDAVQKSIRAISDIEVVYLGELQLKNVDYAVKTYALRGEGLPQPKNTAEKNLAGRFLAEIRRRNVHRVGIVYLAFTFTVISLLPFVPFLNPFKSILYGILSLGLPVSLFLGWTFERSPQGFVRTTSRKSWENPYSDVQKKPFTGITAIITLLVIILLVNVLPIQRNPGNNKSTIQKAGLSIAVMPFRNDSEDANNLYFCNGLMEDVIGQLAQIEEIRVPSVTSMLYYRENPKSYPEIIQELQVSHLLEGSVRKLDNKALMTVTLIDAEKNEQIWSQRYEMDLSVKGVWEIQFNVAGEIIKSLQLALNDNGSSESNAIPTTSFEAYDNYLKARDLHKAWDIQENRKSINLLLQALVLDPSFFLGITEIAQAYGQRAELDDGAWIDSTGFYAEKAAQLDPEHPESLNAMAYYKTLSGNPSLGLELYSKSLELGYKGLHNFRGWCHWQLGDQDKSLEWAFKNLENDPNNLVYYIDISNAAAAMGLFGQANAYNNKALKLKPSLVWAHENQIRQEVLQENYQIALERELFAQSMNVFIEKYWLGLIQIKLGNYDLAMEHLKNYSEDEINTNSAALSETGYVAGVALKAHVLLQQGDSILAKYIFRKILKEFPNVTEYWHPQQSNIMAGCYAGLGMTDEAMKELKIGAGAGIYSYYYLTMLPLLDPIRDLPEYKRIMKDLKSKTERMRDNVLAEGYFDDLEL